MKERVLKHDLWELDDYQKPIYGGSFQTKYLTFKKDTMLFKYSNGDNDTLIFKYQYFNTIKIMNPKTKETAKYTMKGANWMTNIFKKYRILGH